jgi:hypothetical protein
VGFPICNAVDSLSKKIILIFVKRESLAMIAPEKKRIVLL